MRNIIRFRIKMNGFGSSSSGSRLRAQKNVLKFKQKNDNKQLRMKRIRTLI